jgi:hypothetical protein
MCILSVPANRPMPNCNKHPNIGLKIGFQYPILHVNAQFQKPITEKSILILILKYDSNTLFFTSKINRSLPNPPRFSGTWGEDPKP